MQSNGADVAEVDVLLAEDERAVRAGLVRLLTGGGYAVRAVSDGEAALAAFRARRPDLLLLDVAMPKLNGLGVCQAVRRQDASVPVLFLTAYAAAADELRGLAAGADDFIDKASPPEIVLARVAAALRRTAVGGRGGTSDGTTAFAFGRGTVDASALLFRGMSGNVALSLREVEMLRFFAAHPDEVFSRDALLTRFWGLSYDGSESALTMQCKRLREKLCDDGARIVTIRNAGYAYRP